MNGSETVHLIDHWYDAVWGKLFISLHFGGGVALYYTGNVETGATSL